MTIEVREDADGTDSFIAFTFGRLHHDDVILRGEEWRVETETPHSLLLTQWQEHDDDEPTGPRIRVTIAVRVEEVQP